MAGIDQIRIGSDLRRYCIELLNTTGIREDLRKKFPIVDRLESLDWLVDLRLTRLDIGDSISFNYQSLMAPGSHPGLKQKLIEAGVIKPRDVNRHHESLNKGFLGERDTITITLTKPGGRVFLDVYKFPEGCHSLTYWDPNNRLKERTD